MFATQGRGACKASSLPHRETKKEKKKYLYFVPFKLALFIALILVIKINSIAATPEDLQFSIMNIAGEEVPVKCIDSGRRFYEASNPSIKSISTIDGFLPNGYNSVFAKMAVGTHNTSETYPDMFYSYDNGGEKTAFHIKNVNYLIRDEISQDTVGVIELLFSNDQGESISYYIILDGPPHNEAAAGQYYENLSKLDFFSDSIDLVEPSTGESFYNVYDRSIDGEIYPQRKLYQKINLSDWNTDSLALKMDGNHVVPLSFTSNMQEHWISDGLKFFRINGGDWIQFSETNDSREVISPNLELSAGNNLVEICQVYDPAFFIKDNNTSSYCLKHGSAQGNNTKVFNHVLLIHSDKPTASSADDNTDIKTMKAYSWAQVKGDLFLHYRTVLDEQERNYQVILNQEMNYTPVLLSIDTVNPGAQWSIENESGEDISIGRFGHYVAFDSEGCTEFYIRVESADGSKTDRKEVQVISGEASSKAELSGVSFGSDDVLLEKNTQVLEKTDGKYVTDSSVLAYTVETNSDTIEIAAYCNDGATLSIDGESIKPGHMKSVMPREKGISEIVVTASDGMTQKRYYLVYKCNGEYPYFGVSQNTKQLADSMLDGFRTHLDNTGMDLTDDWWMVLMARSMEIPLDKACVFDVRTKDCNIVADYACAALELIAIGENPYDFHGVNYISKTEETLKKGKVGAWNTTLWALIAFKAAGYDYPDMDSFVDTIKEQAQRRESGLSWSIDLGSWAWEAVKDEFAPEDRAEWSEWIHNVNQRKTGITAGMFEDYYYETTNANTNGCVLCALNALNVDPEKFTVVEGKSPLLTLRDQYLTEDGKFYYEPTEKGIPATYNKDIIVGLGDIVAGRSVWDRISINQDMLDQLIRIANSLKGKGDKEQEAALNQALDKALNVEDITKEGQFYFELMDIVREIDPSSVSTSRMCSTDIGKTIDQLITDIDKIGEVSSENADKILDLQKVYDSLPDDLARSYVTNFKLLSSASEEAKKIKAAEQAPTQSDKITKDEEVTQRTEGDGTANLKMTSKSGTSSIKLKWNKIGGVAGYELFRYDGKIKKYKRIASCNPKKTIYTLKRLNGSSGKKLKDGTKYSFKLSAYTLANGKKTYVKSVKLATATAPRKISSISVRKRGKRNMMIFWKKCPRCSGYEIWVKEGKKKYKRVSVIKGGKANKTTLKKLKKKTRYSVKVRSYVSIAKKKVYGKYSKSKTIQNK